MRQNLVHPYQLRIDTQIRVLNRLDDRSIAMVLSRLLGRVRDSCIFATVILLGITQGEPKNHLPYVNVTQIMNMILDDAHRTILHMYTLTKISAEK
jgi:hypothetical protein